MTFSNDISFEKNEGEVNLAYFLELQEKFNKELFNPS